MLEYQKSRWKTEEGTIGKSFGDADDLKRILDVPSITVKSTKDYNIYVAHHHFFGHINVGYECPHCKHKVIGSPAFKISTYPDSQSVKKVSHECIKCHRELYHKIYAKRH